MKPLRAAALALALAPVAAPAHAEDAAAVIEAIRLNDILVVMQEEGFAYADSLATELFPDGRGGPEWEAAVADIYDIDRMQDGFAAALAAELTPEEATAIVAFFTSDTGRTIVELEVGARTAMLEDGVEEMAEENAAIAIADADPRAAQVREFIAANDLIEANVMGAMNSNFAYMTGLADGGALGASLSEEEILADIWMQEPQIRQSTTEWLYAYLLLAYQPLTDGQMDDYIAFSQTDAGRALNEALFGAFDEMFVGISRQLGLASARVLSQTDI